MYIEFLHYNLIIGSFTIFMGKECAQVGAGALSMTPNTRAVAPKEVEEEKLHVLKWIASIELLVAILLVYYLSSL